jgi:hypothetical protein
MVDHVPFLLGTTGMIAAVDQYVNGLPKIRKALMAAILLVLGGFGGGVAATTIGVRRDLERFNVEHKQIFGMIGDDQRAMHDMRLSQGQSISEVTRAVNALTCDLNNVPNSRCEWWIANGRPDNLRNR